MSARYASRSLVDNLPITCSSSTTSSYICRQCRQNLIPSLKSTSRAVVRYQQRRHASDQPEKSGTWAERTRKKLWQGKPPGPENIDDVYGGPGFFATMAKERREKREREYAERESQANKATDSSVPDGRDHRRSHAKRVYDSQIIRDARHEPLTADENMFSEEATREPESSEIASKTEMRKGFGYGTSNREKPARSRLSANVANNQQEGQVEEQPETVRDGQYAALENYMNERRAATTTQAELDPEREKPSDKVRNWDGLEIVGHKGDWREKPISPADDFQPWRTMNKNLAWSHNELVALMHQAMQMAQVPLFTFQEGVEDPDYMPGDPALVLPEDTSFLQQKLDLHDKTTMKILAKFSFLTRRRIPDPVLSTVTNVPSRSTIGDFLQLFDARTRPAPTKVAEILSKSGDDLAGHNNLMVLSRRETSVDREKELGRWKVIEAELTARGLPVLGKVRINRERDSA